AARWPRATVISDLRQRDLAQGGQGAPITPLADWILFKDAGASRAIVNLGGFCNATILPAAQDTDCARTSLDAVRGFDICPCNQLLDWIARNRLGAAFDQRGDAAMRGQPHALLRERLRTRCSGTRSLG